MTKLDKTLIKTRNILLVKSSERVAFLYIILTAYIEDRLILTDILNRSIDIADSSILTDEVNLLLDADSLF